MSPSTKPKRIASPQQVAANRINAARSTGPQTPEGKSRSARNALRHGFAASTFAVIRLEDLQEVAHLKADLIDVYQPVNSQEMFALERMALAQQAILRAARLEVGLFTACLNETLDCQDEPRFFMDKRLVGDGDIGITRAQNRNYLLGDGFHRLSRQSNSWSLFLRYQAQAERNYRRALQEFERLKALRDELPNEPNFAPQPVEEPAICPLSELNPFAVDKTPSGDAEPPEADSVPVPPPEPPDPLAPEPPAGPETEPEIATPLEQFTPVLHPFDPVLHPLTEQS